MAKGDIKIVDVGGKNVVPVRTFQVKSGKGSINAGEPVRLAHEAAAGTGFYVVPLEDGKGTVANMYFLGIAANNATHTSAADGTVDVYLDLPGTIYRVKAKTAASADSTADINSRLFYRYVIDLTSSTYTLDEAGGDGTTNAFIVVGGDPATSSFDFVCADIATWRHWAKV